MASQSQYGSGSQYGGSSSANPFAGHYTKSTFKAPSTSHGHGLLKNLLEDAVNSAKGIPMGLVQTVEHPITTAKLIGKSYQDYYGHGFGHFYHEFHAHPLQPLLDAISVPLIFAGGAGFAIKGASAAAELGSHAAEAGAVLNRVSELTRAGEFAKADEARAALNSFSHEDLTKGHLVHQAKILAQSGDPAAADELRAQAANNPALMRAAQRFQKGTRHTTRMVDTEVPGLSLPYNYSTNLWRRALTKGTQAITESTLGKLPLGKDVPFFSKEGFSRRLVEKDRNLRKSATSAAAYGEASVIKAARKAAEKGDKSFTPEEVGQKLIDHMEQTALQTAHRIPLTKAEKLDPTNPVQAVYGYIKGSRPTVEDTHLGLPNVGGAVPIVTKTTPGQIARAGNVALHGLERGDAEKFVNDLGKHFEFTNDPAKAALDANGNVMMMRHDQFTTFGQDLAGSMTLAKQIYRAPLKVWKAMILGDSPRYLVNNVIGNAGMMTFATGPREATLGVLHAIKSVHGHKAAVAAEGEMAATIDKLMAKYLPNDFVDRTFGHMHHGALGLGPTVEGASRSPFSKLARTGLTGATEKLAYRGPQRASIMGAVTTMPDFRGLYRGYKRTGMSDEEAFQKAANHLMEDPRKRAAIEKRVSDWAGQYYHLNSLEQGITALVPFYNWTRHALRFGKEQVLARPVQSATLASLGALGDKQTEKELGHLPDFLKGAIPVGGHAGGILGMIFGQQVNGRKKVILTSGYNPLAAASEDTRALAALIGGGNAREAIGGQLNPVISGIVGGVTGQKLFSGAKAGYSSPLSGALSETFAQEPHIKLGQTLLSEKLGIGKPAPTKTKKGEPTLYTHDVRQQLSSILGLNERDFSPKAAARLYNAQEGIKKGRGRRHARKFAKSLGLSASQYNY
jgi:hypothetical protein